MKVNAADRVCRTPGLEVMLVAMGLGVESASR
jgi:hypothetical protein